MKLTDFYFSISGRKSELLNELHQLVKGNVGKIIFAHDTVRVIECLVAQGDETIRNALFDEMKDEVISMAKSKFASFFVQKLVKYGTKDQRDAIFKELEGRVCELTKHKIANTLVEACYNDYCNAAQRNRFLQEFFGPEFRYDFQRFAYFISFLSKFSTKSIYLRFQIPSVPTILTLMVSVCDFQAKGFPFLFISVIAIPKKDQNFVQFCR